MSEPLLSVRDLSKHYTSAVRRLNILQGISFDIGKGEVVGLVGRIRQRKRPRSGAPSFGWSNRRPAASVSMGRN